MSICTPCYDAGTIPKCIDLLIVAGTNLSPADEVTIYWENVATDRLETIEGIVASGSIYSATEEGINFPTNVPINIWVTLKDDQPNQYQDLLINGETFTCISFKARNGTFAEYNLAE